MKRLTQKRLKEVLNYDPLTGVFTWFKNRSSRARAGGVAGYKSNGYLKIRIDSGQYYAHRLAWLYIHGYLPENDMDHIDRIKYHNWIDNLRETSRSCNMRNTINRKDNISGVKGVSWNKETNKWRVQISVNSHNKNIGHFKSFDNAVCARLIAEQCLNWSGCDSNSPAYKYVNENIIKRK